MLRFAVNLSLLFSEVELIDRFQAAYQCGFEAVEIQFPYSLSPEAIARELSAYKQRLILFNVAADDLLQGGEGLACVPEKCLQFQQAVDQALDYAKLLRPAAINVLPGRCLTQSRKPMYFETFKRNLRYAADVFSSLGIKTVFEAINTYDMPGFLIQGGDQMLSVLNELKHPGLFMQYDIYHMQMMGEQPTHFIAENSKNIGHIQFADCPGRGQPGTGNVDFEQIFACIENSSYDGWVGAEYHPQGPTRESLLWAKPSFC